MLDPISSLSKCSKLKPDPLCDDDMKVASFSSFACPEVDEAGQITVSVEDETNFDMDRFKRESSTAPLTLLPTPAVTTYPMFNSAPYASPTMQPKNAGAEAKRSKPGFFSPL